MQLKSNLSNVISIGDKYVERLSDQAGETLANGGCVTLFLSDIYGAYTVGNADRIGVELVVIGLPSEAADLVIAAAEKAIGHTTQNVEAARVVGFKEAEAFLSTLLPALAAKTAEERGLDLPTKAKLFQVDRLAVARTFDSDEDDLAGEFVQIVYAFPQDPRLTGNDAGGRKRQLLIKRKKVEKPRRRLTAR